MAYTAKDYSKLVGMEGFSETLLKNHFTLYQGYVTNTNNRMLIRELLPREVLNERINALGIRSQLKSVAADRAQVLDTDRKKLAYLFLSEYAVSLPNVQDDFQTYDWALDQMKRIGFFKQ